jgi:hypothetical protein
MSFAPAGLACAFSQSSRFPNSPGFCIEQALDMRRECCVESTLFYFCTAAKRGYESRRSLAAYDRKFKHELRAGLEISQLTKGFVGKAEGLEI